MYTETTNQGNSLITIDRLHTFAFVLLRAGGSATWTSMWRSVTFEFVYFKSLCVFCFLFYFVVSLSLYVVPASRVCHFRSWWLGSPVPHVLHLWPIPPAFPVPLYNPLCSPVVASGRTGFNTVSLMVYLVPAVLSASLFLLGLSACPPFSVYVVFVVL